MKGKKAALMERQTLPPALPEDFESDSSSLSDSFKYSETESLGESVGSVKMAGCSERKPSLELRSPKRRSPKRRKGCAKFLHVSWELQDVPVPKAWASIRNHKMLASMVPAVIKGFDFIEGEGGTGSIYVLSYNPSSVKPGEDQFLIKKVEVCDEESKLYAVRCVGGKYTKFYNLYVTYFSVRAHAVDGDSSSVVVCRFEYDLIDPKNAPTEYSKIPCLAGIDHAIDRIRVGHLAMNRVERPLVVTRAALITITHRLTVPAGQKLLTGADEEQKPEYRFQQKPDGTSEQRRKRKVKVKGKAQQSRVNDDEGNDRESRVTETRWRKTLRK